MTQFSYKYSQSNQLTNQSLPLAIGLGDLIHAAHLTVCHASNDEDDYPGPCLHLCGAPVLVPVTIASTVWWVTDKHLCQSPESFTLWNNDSGNQLLILYHLKCVFSYTPWWSTGFGRCLSLGNIRVLLGIKFVFNCILWEDMQVATICNCTNCNPKYCLTHLFPKYWHKATADGKYLHEILDKRGPPGELVGLLTDPFLAIRLLGFLGGALWTNALFN